MSTQTNNLKDEIKQSLIKSKEKEIKEQKEVFGKLKKINLYCTDKNPICKQYSDFLEEIGIKMDKKDMDISVASILGSWTQPAVSVNGVNLVINRDFANPKQLSQVLLSVANPEYVLPPFEVRMEEGMKNHFNALKNHITALNRMMTPVAKTLAGLSNEVNNEVSSKKTKKQSPAKPKKLGNYNKPINA